MTYNYFINLDECGVFSADVRNQDDVSLYELGNNYSSQDKSEEIEVDEDFFESSGMKHKNDLDGLKNHLIEIGIIEEGSKLVKAN